MKSFSGITYDITGKGLMKLQITISLPSSRTTIKPSGANLKTTLLGSNNLKGLI